MRNYHILPTVLIGAIAFFGASNTLGGMALRASIALPLVQLTIISDEQFMSFALDAHVVELPAPFGFASKKAG